LQQALVDVFLVPREYRKSGTAAADAALSLIDRYSPAVVTFWNVNVEVKLRLADGLLSPRIFDVSPGEMFFEEFDRYFRRMRDDLPYLSPRDYARNLAGIIVKHHGEIQRATDYFGVVPSVIHNGVPVYQGRRVRESGSLVRHRLGTLARLSPDKRLEELLLAIGKVHASLPDVVLFVGGGADVGFEDYARGLIASTSGLPVVWLGEVRPSELFERIELFVLNAEPSGFPNASLEAMEYGLPVLATDSGGVSEQIQHGVNGWLAARGEPEQLADLMIEVLKDHEKLSECGIAAREIVLKRFAVEHMGERYLDVLGLSEAIARTP
jgi:glycosyltransferase involved in cell wall biosynthesis